MKTLLTTFSALIFSFALAVGTAQAGKHCDKPHCKKTKSHLSHNIMKDLNLTDEQKQLWTKAKANEKNIMKQMQADMKKKHAALKAMVNAEMKKAKPDYQKVMDAKHALHKDMSEWRTKMRNALKPFNASLTDEQKKTLLQKLHKRMEHRKVKWKSLHKSLDKKKAKATSTSS